MNLSDKQRGPFLSSKIAICFCSTRLSEAVHVDVCNSGVALSITCSFVNLNLVNILDQVKVEFVPGHTLVCLELKQFLLTTDVKASSALLMFVFIYRRMSLTSTLPTVMGRGTRTTLWSLNLQISSRLELIYCFKTLQVFCLDCSRFE